MKIILCFFCLLSFISPVYSNEQVQIFLRNLSKEQVSVLDWFFRNCLKSFGGYVLYGDKPMCIESFMGESIALNSSEFRIAKIKAFQMLKEWNSPENECLFLFCKYPHSAAASVQHSHMIMINRKAFLKAVNDNISLFRYVLGRTLTAESLLQELVKNEKNFWEILKDDNVLVGILLGYGTNNSLLVSRLEYIAKNEIPKKEAFPFFNERLQDRPFLGFQTLAEERVELSKKTVYSRNILDYDSYHIPPFGCEPHSNETAALLSTYDRNRHEIMAIAEQKDFLEKVLEKVFTRTSGEIHIPVVSFVSSTFDSSDKKKNAAKFAEILWDEQSIFETFLSNVNSRSAIKQIKPSVLIRSFLQGVNDREKEITLDSSFGLTGLELCELNTMPDQMECCKRIIAINECFKKISKRKDWSFLIPNGIAYKVLKPGKGKPVSSKLTNVTFDLSYRLGTEKYFGHWETIKTEQIGNLLPGIAHALIGMKRGEERLVCIHPRYAYGINTRPLDETFIARLQLSDFKEGDVEASFLPICDLEPTISYGDDLSELTPFPMCNVDMSKNKDLLLTYKNLLKKYQKVVEKKFYSLGNWFWNAIKDNEIEVDFEIFSREVNSLGKLNHFKDSKEMESFIVDFKLYLFTKQYEKGKAPSFPHGWF